MADDARRSLVVVGSSAGGIDALSILLGALPAGLPAPVVIAQHVDPRRESHLAEILAKRSDLTVETVEDDAEMRAGVVYVVPANRDVDIADGHLRLRHRSDGSAPSIDRLLGSASEAYGEGLIAVILTGMGSDGALGARRVKAAGGTVIVQDPTSARYPSMPASLAPSTVDITAPVEAIAGILRDLLTGMYLPSEADEAALLDTFLASLRAQTGLDFASYKRPTIIRRLQRRMTAAQTPKLRDYIRHVRRHPEEYERLANSFLIKVTDFFRDPELFELLRDSVIPKLIDEAEAHGRELRVWSAGCSTGEEAYSLAILVAEGLGDRLPDWTVRIFATDLDNSAITYARRGVYPSAALADVPPDIVERYFDGRDGEYEVNGTIRAMTVFGQHDLAQRAPFPRIDLVLCRNVLIYFTPELQKRALHLFAFSLRNGGWLALGKAETTTPLGDFFDPVDTRLKLYRRHGERLVLPPLAFEGAVRNRDRPGIARLDARRQRAPGAGAPATAGAANAALPFGVVTVDGSYDVVDINPAARELLAIRSAAVGNDFVHLAAAVPSSELRSILDAAIGGHTRSIVATTTASTMAPAATLRIEAFPRPRQADGSKLPGAVVAIRDVTSETAPGGTPAANDEPGATDAELVRRLRDTNDRLIADNRDLVAANAALRTSTEEMQVSNEEIQAATEEVETLNEELQATNEELETLNEELQATVEELNTTNDDINARTVELQELAVRLESERRTAELDRARLAALIETMTDAVLVVDSGGRPIIRNRAYIELFEEQHLQPEDDDGRPIAPPGDLERRVSAGEPFVVQFRATDATGRRRWFEAYGRPMPPSMGVAGGGILVVHDTTDLSLRRLQEEFVAVVAHELRTPLTALRGYLQMLNRQTDGDARLAPLALEQADRLKRLVDELFDVTRADTGRLVVDRRPVRLMEVVDETVEIAQSLADGQEIRIEQRDDELRVEADPGRLQQVLLNVLTNALVHAAESPDVLVRVRALRRRVEIEIEDHGPGIAAAERERVFSRFQQGEGRLRGGLGIGLYVSRQIVTAHGGTMEVDSEIGEGATFTIRLPLIDRSAPRRTNVTPDVAQRNGGNGSGAGSGTGNGRSKRTTSAPRRRR